MYTSGQARPAGAAGANEGTRREGRGSRVARLRADAASGRVAAEERGRGGRSLAFPRVMRFCRARTSAPSTDRSAAYQHLAQSTPAASFAPFALLRNRLWLRAGPLRSHRFVSPPPARPGCPLPSLALWHHRLFARTPSATAYLHATRPSRCHSLSYSSTGCSEAPRHICEQETRLCGRRCSREPIEPADTLPTSRPLRTSGMLTPGQRPSTEQPSRCRRCDQCRLTSRGGHKTLGNNNQARQGGQEQEPPARCRPSCHCSELRAVHAGWCSVTRRSCGFCISHIAG